MHRQEAYLDRQSWQALIGYSIHPPCMGMVGGMHPLRPLDWVSASERFDDGGKVEPAIGLGTKFLIKGRCMRTERDLCRAALSGGDGEL